MADITVLYFSDLVQPVNAALTVALVVTAVLLLVERRRYRRCVERIEASFHFLDGDPPDDTKEEEADAH